MGAARSRLPSMGIGSSQVQWTSKKSRNGWPLRRAVAARPARPGAATASGNSSTTPATERDQEPRHALARGRPRPAASARVPGAAPSPRATQITRRRWRASAPQRHRAASPAAVRPGHDGLDVASPAVEDFEVMVHPTTTDACPIVAAPGGCPVRGTPAAPRSGGTRLAGSSRPADRRCTRARLRHERLRAASRSRAGPPPARRCLAVGAPGSAGEPLDSARARSSGSELVLALDVSCKQLGPAAETRASPPRRGHPGARMLSLLQSTRRYRTCAG